jgi:hypothetical protein
VGGGWAQDSAAFAFPSGAPIWTDTNTHGGWLLGGGIEYGFKPNWTVKLEYDYLKLGGWTAPTVPAEWRRDVQMIKMGMNYKFESGNSDDATRTPDDSVGSARAKGRAPGSPKTWPRHRRTLLRRWSPCRSRTIAISTTVHSDAHKMF